jgi:hypothetical protein
MMQKDHLFVSARMMSLKLLALAAMAVLLAGCASTLSARVTSFQQWPGNVEGQTYRLVPGPSQDASGLEYQAFADMLRASIGPTGLVEAAAGRSARFDVSFHYENPVTQTWVERYDDRFYPGFSPFWGYYGGYYGWGGGMFYSPPVVSVPVDAYKNQLTVTITDNQQNGRQVYRSSAVNESLNDNLAGVMPYLAQAVFDGFPGNNGQVRTVRYQLD